MKSYPKPSMHIGWPPGYTQTLRRLHSCESDGGNIFTIVFITLKDTLEYCLVFDCVCTVITPAMKTGCRHRLGISVNIISQYPSVYQVFDIFSTHCAKPPDLRNITQPEKRIIKNNKLNHISWPWYSIPVVLNWLTN